MSQFIGKGERRVGQILEMFFGARASIIPQAHIQGIIKPEDYAPLGPELNKHKFDFLIQWKKMFDYDNRPDIILEVNYKHGEGAYKKWNDHFYPAILNADKIPVTIEDRECLSLFKGTETRSTKWQDIKDVISAFETARIPF